MANENLFEKFGIKEVADVTIFRIEKKEETYESTRTIQASSILKGALEIREVYPLDSDGAGEEDGFKAYVFTDGTLIKGTNYDCDDDTTIKAIVEFKYNSENQLPGSNAEAIISQGIQGLLDKAENQQIIVDAIIAGDKEFVLESDDGSVQFEGLSTLVVRDEINEKIIPTSKVNTYETGDPVSIGGIRQSTSDNVGQITYKATVTFEASGEKNTGVYDNTDSTVPDKTLEVGTHEYSYPEQICMLFAKRQNILAKTGVRYVFNNADTIFGDITFEDEFAVAPFSTERVIVAGLAGKFTEDTYDFNEISEVIKNLTDSIEAKAYDVKYGDYAELVVEDEMGYYNPYFLGHDFNRKSQSISFYEKGGEDYAKAFDTDNVDMAIAEATMWGDNLHYSINDAIDALRQKQLILDAGEDDGVAGINSIFGGYKVSSKATVVDATPEAGNEDTDYDSNKYEYKTEEDNALVVITDKDGNAITSGYPLDKVNTAVGQIDRIGTAFGKDLRVDIAEGGKPSNRAIYVKVDSAVDAAAGAYIYLLRNVNYKKLSLDKVGIFSFNDKKGNKLYYQDKIFKGVEYLALVVLGDKGLIFVVNRHGTRSVERIGWMVNDKGYVNNNQAKTLVKKGLIHTTNITVNDETFEATCSVIGLKTHITKKVSPHYIPVLFLDSLKVSTIEQTAEEVYATGGKGNSNLIGWDYGKEITLSIQDALFTPASMSVMFGSSDGEDIRKGIKETKVIDRMEPIIAERNFIVPAGNQNGTPTEANKTAQAVYYDPRTMEPFADGTPIVEGEKVYKYTRSIAYEGQSIGKTIEISADKFPGTYKVVGDTYVRSDETGKDERFQFIIPQAKMSSEQTITLEADGDPSVNIFSNALVKVA